MIRRGVHEPVEQRKVIDARQHFQIGRLDHIGDIAGGERHFREFAIKLRHRLVLALVLKGPVAHVSEPVVAMFFEEIAIRYHSRPVRIRSIQIGLSSKYENLAVERAIPFLGRDPQAVGIAARLPLQRQRQVPPAARPDFRRSDSLLEHGIEVIGKHLPLHRTRALGRSENAHRDLGRFARFVNSVPMVHGIDPQASDHRGLGHIHWH